MAVHSDSTSSSLLERVKQFDQPAWEKLVRIYGPLVFHWCRARARLPDEDAADVVQTVFSKVAQDVPRFDHHGDGSTFRGWLRVITQNAIRDHFRKKGREPAREPSLDFDNLVRNWPAPDDSSEAADPTERSLLVRRVLEEIQADFDPHTWQAFWRAEVDGVARRDIAEALGMSVAAVNQAIYRIRHRLRQEFDDLLK